MPDGVLNLATGIDPSAKPGVADPASRVTTTGETVTSAIRRMPCSSDIYAESPKKTISCGLLNSALVPRPSAVPIELPAMVMTLPSCETARILLFCLSATYSSPEAATTRPGAAPPYIATLALPSKKPTETPLKRATMLLGVIMRMKPHWSETKKNLLALTAME